MVLTSKHGYSWNVQRRRLIYNIVERYYTNRIDCIGIDSANDQKTRKNKCLKQKRQDSDILSQVVDKV